MTRVCRGKCGSEGGGGGPRRWREGRNESTEGFKDKGITKDGGFALVREILPVKSPSPRMRQETRHAASKWM